MEIRPYHPDDEQALVTLWNECLTRDRITPEVFRETTLLDPNFEPGALLLAVEEDRLVGAVCGMRRAVAWWGYAPAPQSGCITTLFVAPAHQRQSIGSRLLVAAMDFLRSQDCVDVRFAHFSPHYYFPGVDEVAYPGALAFFNHHGFQVEERVVAMGRSLYDLVVPAQVIECEERLAAQGVRCCFFEPRYLLPTVSFFNEIFPPWGYYFRRKLQVRPWPLDEMVIVRDGDRVIGYCQQLEAEHVGPFGIHPEFRNRGVGTVMLYHLLRRMQEKGYRHAWFGMTDRAEPYYARAGFIQTRAHFRLYRRITE